MEGAGSLVVRLEDAKGVESAPSQSQPRVVSLYEGPCLGE